MFNQYFQNQLNQFDTTYVGHFKQSMFDLRKASYNKGLVADLDSFYLDSLTQYYTDRVVPFALYHYKINELDTNAIDSHLLVFRNSLLVYVSRLKSHKQIVSRLTIPSQTLPTLYPIVG